MILNVSLQTVQKVYAVQNLHLMEPVFKTKLDNALQDSFATLIANVLIISKKETYARIGLTIPVDSELDVLLVLTMDL